MDVLKMINQKWWVNFCGCVGVLAVAFGSATVSAQYSYSNSRMNYSPTRYMQGTLGRFDVYSRGRETEVSSPYREWRQSFNSFGFVGQLATDRGDFQYGLEVGAQVGHDSNSGYSVSLAGSDSQVRVRSEQWLGDFSLGGFVSFRSADWFRVYASAGPALYWGRVGTPEYRYYDTRTDRVDDGNANRFSVDLTGEERDLKLVPYARLGLEFTVNRQVNLGVNVRRLNGDLDFGRWGSTALDEPAYMLTIGYHY